MNKLKALFLLTFCLTAVGVNAQCKEHLFRIAKSDNANVLYYDAIIENDEFNTKTPINIYWIMHAEKGQVEKMTRLEKPQFDLIVKEVEPGKVYTVNIRNKQLSNKDITVFFDEESGCPVATLLLNGEEAYIDNVFVHIKPKSGLIPTVTQVDLNGTEINTGESIQEVVTNK